MAGWQDAPLVEQPAATGKPAWEAAPLVAAEPKQESILDKVRKAVQLATPAGVVGALASSDGRQNLIDAGAGAIRGAGSIGATILAPLDVASDAMAGKGVGLQANRDRRAAMDEGLRAIFGADPNSTGYGLGRLATEVAGTMPIGGIVGNGLKAAGATRLGTAVASGGMQTGAPAATTLAGKAGDMALRTAGGVISGGATAGAVDPEMAGTGAVVGGAVPVVSKVVGSLANAARGAMAGPAVPAPVVDAAKAAREAGYVLPPSTVNPTLGNRAAEGVAGKITLSQQASAKNQEITNRLARQALGLDELTPEAIATLRRNSNAAYDALGDFGTVTADDAYRAALQKAAGRSEALAKDFPELANQEVENLVRGMAGREGFNAQSAIEAVKRLRFDGAANKGAMDPAKRALGDSQMKIAGAIEDLIDRNLAAQGAQDLLGNFRNARTTLAKAYDVEKALNTTTGNVDAAKLAALLKKGRPLTGELKQIAEFAQAYPKMVQLPERIGAQPGVSPLDFYASLGTSVATGNPLPMAGMVARPAIRSTVLSEPMQNRAMAAAAGRMQPAAPLLSDADRQAIQILFARGAPVAVQQR